VKSWALFTVQVISAAVEVTMLVLFWMVVLVSPQLTVITCESTPFRKFVIVVGAPLFVLNTLPADTSGVAPVMMIVWLFEMRSVLIRPYSVCA